MLKKFNFYFWQFLTDCKRWFSYMKPCFSTVDFDSESILLMELHQLKRVRDSIVHYQNHLNWKRDVERMDTAIRLLDLIVHDEKLEAKYYSVNLRNKSRFTDLDMEDKDFEYDNTLCAELKLCPSKLHKFNTLRYEVYYQKVWQIYHAFREQWLRTWWD